MVSTLMPTRLLSAFLLSVLMLGEGFKSLTQLLGAIIVFATVSVYLKVNANP